MFNLSPLLLFYSFVIIITVIVVAKADDNLIMGTTNATSSVPVTTLDLGVYNSNPLIPGDTKTTAETTAQSSGQDEVQTLMAATVDNPFNNVSTATIPTTLTTTSITMAPNSSDTSSTVIPSVFKNNETTAVPSGKELLNNNGTTAPAITEEPTPIPTLRPTPPPTQPTESKGSSLNFFGFEIPTSVAMIACAVVIVLLAVFTIYRCFCSSKKQPSITNKSNTAEKIVNVPPGKLGVAIDRISEGLVISNVGGNSPLKNDVQAGDLLLKINGTDVSGMKVSEVCEMLTRTSKRTRELTILTESTVKSHRRSSFKRSSINNLKDHYIGWIEKIVTIGPGNLRLGIKPTPKGLVVEEIYVDSQLFGKVKKGDVITAINIVSTCSLPVKKVSEFLSSFNDVDKEITLLTPDDDDDEELGLHREMITVGPGRLGISVDTTDHGVTVVNISRQSILHDRVNMGDVITSINQISTLSISPKSLSDLLQSVQDTNKELSILTRKPKSTNLDI